MNARRVLFVTKKKAINSIIDDFRREGYDYHLDVTNFENTGKYGANYDIVVVDEAHSLGAYPKPSLRTKNIKNIVRDNYLILLSGTPSPETESQLYHQFWISEHNPFSEHNFYRWAKNYVDIREVVRNGYRINDYSRAKRELIMQVLDPYILTYTQKDAGFHQTEIIEQTVFVPMNDNIRRLIKRLLEARYFMFGDGKELVCDTPVKLQQKIHQICSGTVITETGDVKVLDVTKAEFIRDAYRGKKIAIFYKFKAEGEVLRRTFSNHTDDPKIFAQDKDKVFICQIVSGSMGTDLSSADVLIFYNIDFSAVHYWQARARLGHMQRATPPVVHWIFTIGGIEQKIYKVVQSKKDYTLKYFLRDYERKTATEEGIAVSQ